MGGLIVHPDGSEAVRYNALDFPVRTGFSQLSVFPDYAADCHWHRDFEFLVALDADIEYMVNGRHMALRQGEAVFVNSGRLHYGFSTARRECHYCYLVFHPSFLGSSPAVAAAVDQLSADAGPDCWLLTPDAAGDAIRRIRYICDHAVPGNALAIQAACAGLLEDVRRLAGNAASAPDPEWAVLRAMVGYIQSHYQEKIRLEDIAAAGAVCRSRCCALFRKKLKTTPAAYVTHHRLEKACAALREGVSVTDAAFSAGFQGLSYFCETFRKAYGVRPSEYVRQIRREK
ncbi:MAG: helix-turn-helix transcriptional regulator [Clostridia bacterium]|nr:helix-turn-helix transcriptional regulator [Clostridia bacterium]